MVAEDGHEMQKERSLDQRKSENATKDDSSRNRKDRESQREAQEEAQSGGVQNESYMTTTALKHGDLGKRRETDLPEEKTSNSEDGQNTVAQTKREHLRKTLRNQVERQKAGAPDEEAIVELHGAASR